jgi:hypothetical protein
MTTKRIVSAPGSIGLAFGILLIVAVLVASRIAGPVAGFGLSQPAHAPLTLGAKDEQPVIGRALTVMGLVYDGARYRNVPVQVAASAAGRGYTVTALVYDGTTYRTAPVRVGGR